ncbi:MAG TPA: N-acetylglucosamine-6-phosphate deacetylase [Candidatus Binataceae bacterium]|nr:N-acetylglucosamine-6-phosphate deacetylase [Candidatus Binataceae bacterium]
MRALVGLVALPDGALAPGRLVFSSTITEVDLSSGAPGGDYILPGLIDLQVNGGGGIDVPRATPSALGELARRLALAGTTAFLPTAITAPLEELAQVERVVAEAIQSQRPPGAELLGLHLEGPFISPVRLGVHPQHALEPRGPALERIAALERLRLITMAPELPGAPAAIQALRRRGVAVSLGHSDATLEQTRAALAAGAGMFTHVFNAMRPLHQREPGIVGAALAPGSAFAGLIADGVHLHPEIVRLLYRARGAGGLLLTSDSVAPASLEPAPPPAIGAHRIGARLAGSLITMLDGLRFMVEKVGAGVGEAALMAATNPARVLALEERGRIAPGTRADLLVLDRQLRLKAVFLGGEELS